jgi:inosose dehydratase
VIEARVANAPCTYGAFEITIGIVAGVPEPDEMLQAMADAGYAGTELGPVGYLGSGEELRARLERHGLELAGGFIPLRLSEPQHRRQDLAVLAESLDAFSAAGAPQARPVLADAGSPERVARPGQAVHDRWLGLDDAGWSDLAEGLAAAVELCRSRRFEATFHPHAGTYVEAPWEIERMLELSDVGLVIDTGHLLLGGSDPTEALRRHRERVTHVHLKDVNLDVLRGAIADGADMPECWRRHIFCRLGAGDVDLEAFASALEDAAYRGWIVVEQDWVPAPGEAEGQFAAQAGNRRWLRDRLGV